MVPRRILSSCRNITFFVIVGFGPGSCMHEAYTEDGANSAPVSQKITAPAKIAASNTSTAKFDWNNTDGIRNLTENAGKVKPGNK
jgi:hypothetical protein